MGGKLHRIKVWLPWFKPHIAYWLSEALRACESTVIERAKERESTQPNAISRLSLPPDYDVGDMGRGGKYPQFDPRLLFPKHRRYLESPSTYEPDPFTREKLEAIQDYWQGLDASVRVKGLDAEERAEGVRQGIQEVLTHPMYGLIQAAKFRMSEERRRRSSNIDNLVNECSMGKRPVEDLLEWALTSKPDLVAELAQQGGSTGKAAGHRRKQVGDRLYRQVDAWFRRRNSRMPRPSSDWRDKILK
jgi:hypothetical protein